MTEITEEEYDRLFAVNSKAAFLVTSLLAACTGLYAHKSSAMHGELTKIEDIVPWVRQLLTDGWWANGRTLFLNGGHTTRRRRAAWPATVRCASYEAAVVRGAARSRRPRSGITSPGARCARRSP